MKRIVIICACVVMLAALGFAAWRIFFPKTLYNQNKPTFIAERWTSVGYDSSGNKLLPDKNDPLIRMNINQSDLNNELNITRITQWDFEKQWREEFNGEIGAYSKIVGITFDEIVKFLRVSQKRNLILADASSSSNINAKVGDLILLYNREPKDSKPIIEYQSVEDGDKQYKFLIYEADKPGNQTIFFKQSFGQDKFKIISVPVTVTK
jgi:hypothetical protein